MRTFVVWAVVLLVTAGVAAGIGAAVAYYEPAPAAAEVPAQAIAADPVRAAELAVSGQGVTLEELITHLRDQARFAAGPVTLELRVILAEGPDGTVRLLMPGPGYAGRVEALSTIRVELNARR